MEIIIGLVTFLLLKIAMITPFAREIAGTDPDGPKKAGLH
jgi:hypothetical protein